MLVEGSDVGAAGLVEDGRGIADKSADAVGELVGSVSVGMVETTAIPSSSLTNSCLPSVHPTIPMITSTPVSIIRNALYWLFMLHSRLDSPELQ